MNPVPPCQPAELRPWSDDDEAAWQELHHDDPDAVPLDLDEVQT